MPLLHVLRAYDMTRTQLVPGQPSRTPKRVAKEAPYLQFGPATTDRSTCRSARLLFASITGLRLSGYEILT